MNVAKTLTVSIKCQGLNPVKFQVHLETTDVSVVVGRFSTIDRAERHRRIISEITGANFECGG